MRKDVRKYPQVDCVRISTSTVLSCAGCRGEIRMFENCLAGSDGKYYHVGHQPKHSTEVKGSVRPSAASEGEEDGGG